MIIKKTHTLNNTIVSFAREEWLPINLGEGFVNESRMEISSFGRLRSFNKISNGKILNGSMINGYRIIRQKFFKPRDPKITVQWLELQTQYLVHSKKVAAIKISLLSKTITPFDKKTMSGELESEELLLKKTKSIYTSFYNKDLKKRTTHHAALIHRLVAENFIKKQHEDQTVVAHLDFDKLNNQVLNLKWMTPEENSKHQQLSPKVIENKQKRKQSGFHTAGYRKLTLTKVMFLKKLLNEGVPVRNLAKQFKVTETQIIRIKKQENWASVEAAR